MLDVDLKFYDVKASAPTMPEPYRVLRVPDEGRYMVLVDDWDTALWNFKPRSLYKNYKKDPPWNALPATVPTEKLFFALSEEWQWFYFDLIRRATFETMSNAALKDAYQKTVRDAGGWRDRHTWNNVDDPPKVYTDHVLGLNLFSRYGNAAQQDLLSSGNIVKVIGEEKGRWLIETLDPFQSPPSVDEVWGKWWLVGFMTLSGYNWETKERARLKWPFFNGYGGPHMNLGRGGTNLLEKYWTRPIANGAEFSLYA